MGLDARGGERFPPGRVEIGTHSAAGLKGAWRSGDWWRDSQWRRLSVTAVGATVLFFGLVAIFVAIGPMPVKLLVGGVMVVYAIARTAWGVARA